MKHFLLTAAAILATASIAQADLLTNTSYEPRQGQTTSVGSLRLTYPTTPAPNAECSEQASITRNGIVLASLPNSSSNVQIGGEYQQGDNDAAFLFTKNPYTQPGTYVISVPEGFFTFNDGADKNAAVEYTYVIADKIEYSVSPATGYVTALPKMIKVTFPGVVEIINNNTPADSEETNIIRFDSPKGKYLPNPTFDGGTATFSTDVNESENAGTEEEALYRPGVKRAPWGNYTWTGEYILHIAAGNLTLKYENGTEVECQDMRLKWIIPTIPFPAIEPEQGEVESLKEISITLQDGYFGMWNTLPSLFLAEEDGSYVKANRVSSTNKTADWDGKVIRSYNMNTLTFSFPYEIKTPGNYVFVIGKGAFGMQNPTEKPSTMYNDVRNDCEYLYYYTIKGNDTTAVEEIEAAEEPETAVVYTIDGVLVGRALDSEAVKALPKGLYIVNGKKIIK